MIRLDISSLIFFYTLFSAIVILVVWIIGSYGRRNKIFSRDVDYIWKCQVCANIYVDSTYEDLSKCPLCGSFNKRESIGGGK